MQVATIDHSMWFHSRPFNINDWLLYSVESTSASPARGFVRGEFYTQDGTLVASTVQEGVMRNREPLPGQIDALPVFKDRQTVGLPRFESPCGADGR